jgi:altronate dehydratase large subunit
MMNFQGYRRADGRAGTRNTVLVIPSVGCSQEAARRIVQGLKGAVHLPNILGCGQMGEDRTTVKRTLTGFGLNPNVFGVLVVGLGCEELAADKITKGIRPSGKRVEALVIQEAGKPFQWEGVSSRRCSQMRQDFDVNRSPCGS